MSPERGRWAARTLWRRRSARSSSRNFSSACFEGLDIRAGSVPSDDLARVVAYRLEPSQDQRNAPSWRRRRPSTSPLLPDATISAHFSLNFGRSSGEPSLSDGTAHHAAACCTRTGTAAWGSRPSVTLVACGSICTILSSVGRHVAARYACRCIERMRTHRYGNRMPNGERLKAQGDS